VLARTPKLLRSTFVGLVVVTGANIAYGLHVRRPIEVGDPARVQFLEHGEIRSLSRHRAGLCKYVIIADVDCASCRTAATDWERDFRQGGLSIPGDWTVFWLVKGDPAVLAPFMPGEPPFEVLPLRSPARAFANLGVQSVPRFVVADRDGRMVETGGGARLPAGDAYSPDCTVQSTQRELTEIGG
jgi:hypothetical protein